MEDRAEMAVGGNSRFLRSDLHSDGDLDDGLDANRLRDHLHRVCGHDLDSDEERPCPHARSAFEDFLQLQPLIIEL